MDTKIRGIFMTGFEAAMQLADTRRAVDNNNLELAKSRFGDYKSTLNRLVKDCSGGKRDLNYVLSEAPDTFASWFNAMQADVKTIKGDTEAGAILIVDLLENCGCSCALKEG